MSGSSVHTPAIPGTQSKRIVGLFPELLGAGGVQEAGRQTAAALDEIVRRLGWALDQLSLNDEPGARAVRVEKREIGFTGFGRSKIGFVVSALRLARNNTRIVIAAHPHLALPASVMKIRSHSLKTIVMAHGIEVWNRMPFLRRRALLHADFILAPSSDTARKLADVQSIPAGKIRKVPWPVNAEILQLADDSARLLPPAGFPQGLVVLTVARWAASERYKGADELIEAVAQLRGSIPDLHLVAVGGGDDLPRLRKLAVDRGIAGRVSFLEGLTREQIAACYARCDVFALPSTGEGFGLVFLEAMAFAKPAIGADSGGIPDLVENNVNGLLIPPRDGAQLVQALGQLLRDPSLRARLGGQGARIVRNKFDFAAFQRNLELVLDEAGLD